MIFLGSSVGAPNGYAQEIPPSRQLQEALQLLGNGDTANGTARLESLTTNHPEFLPGWMSLGQAYRGAGSLERSLAAFEEADRHSPGTAVILFQVGVAHGMLNNLDDAFDWLFRAKETGVFLTANIANSPAAAALSSDPRYAHLFPGDGEYADPFVEDIDVLQDWFGENARDTFGWIARNVGDVDGDGIDDATTSSPGFNSASGKVYTYSSGTGELLWSVEGEEVGGRLGHGIEAAGDVNADGTPDVVAAAPYANKMFVYSGKDGSELLSRGYPDSTGAFGLSVKGIGDVNGDGHSDILVGIPFQVWGAPINGGDLSRAGQAQVLSGKDGSVLLTIEGEGAGDGFGSAVSGRATRDGFMFIVGAPGAGSAGTGKAYIYADLSGMPRFVVEPDSGSAQFASMFLSVVGDLNGDGSDDVYISDWGDNSVAPGAGKAYLYSGRDGSLLYSIVGHQAGEGFGIGISDAGDVNGDGKDDLVVGAWQHSSAAPSGGRLAIHSGSDGSFLFGITGKVAGETLGFDTTGIGDVDGDGHVDFLVTSAYSMRHGFQAGRTLIISGRAPSNTN